MVLADWICIAAAVVVVILGALVGFGKGIGILTGGIVGIAISVFICYCFGGLIIQLSFVQTALERFASLWSGSDNFFCRVLDNIHLEVIVYYIVLFLIVQILRKIIVKIISVVGKNGFALMKAVDRILGAILFAAAGVLVFLFAFQVIYWLYGTDTEFALKFTSEISGVFKLDQIYLNNPLAAMVNYVRGAF